MNMAIKFDPLNPYLYYGRGNLHIANGEYAEAIVDYSAAIEHDADLAEAYYNRGMARLAIDDKPNGIADLSKAGELGLYDAYSIIKRNSSTEKK